MKWFKNFIKNCIREALIDIAPLMPRPVIKIIQSHDAKEKVNVSLENCTLIGGIEINEYKDVDKK